MRHYDIVIARVFCGSMCDWAELHANPDTRALMDAARIRLFALIKATPWLDWLLLTKRIADAATLLPWSPEQFAGQDAECGYWPNVWVGTTAGTRKALRENIPILRDIPAAVRFISCEPILEDVPAPEWDAALRPLEHGEPGIDWLIVGDESGPNARPAQPDWVRGAREAALRHGVAFHFKQWAGRDVYGIRDPVPNNTRNGRKIHLPILDGRQWAQFPK